VATIPRGCNGLERVLAATVARSRELSSCGLTQTINGPFDREYVGLDPRCRLLGGLARRIGTEPRPCASELPGKATSAIRLQNGCSACYAFTRHEHWTSLTADAGKPGMPDHEHPCPAHPDPGMLTLAASAGAGSAWLHSLGPGLPSRNVTAAVVPRASNRLMSGFRRDADHDAGRPVLGILCAREPGGRGTAGYILGLPGAGQVSRGSPGGRWTGTGAGAWTWCWTRSAGSARG
jgi:hypothetical protein